MRLSPWIRIASALAVGALVAGPAHAQQPDAQQPEAQDPEAQEPDEPPREPLGAGVPRFAIAVMVGTLGERPIQSQPVLAERRDAAGTVLETATLTRSIAGDGGIEAAVQGELSLGPVWALRLGLGAGRTRFAPEYRGEEDIFVAAADHLAAGEGAAVTVLTIEGALRMRIPSSRRAQPYLELGAAALRWQSSTPFAGGADLSGGANRLAGVAAAGLVVPIRDRLSARIHGSARAYRTPLNPVSPGTRGPTSSTLAISFLAPETAPFADPGQELITALRLDIGLSAGLGALATAPDPPPAPEPAPPPAP